jgi:hypothetical protein
MSSFDCTSPAHFAVEKFDYIVLVKESGTPGQSVRNGSGCYLIPCLYQRTMARTTQTLNRKTQARIKLRKRASVLSSRRSVGPRREFQSFIAWLFSFRAVSKPHLSEPVFALLLPTHSIEGLRADRQSPLTGYDCCMIQPADVRGRPI